MACNRIRVTKLLVMDINIINDITDCSCAFCLILGLSNNLLCIMCHNSNSGADGTAVACPTECLPSQYSFLPRSCWPPVSPLVQNYSFDFDLEEETFDLLSPFGRKYQCLDLLK